MKSRGISRREFIKYTALSAGALTLVNPLGWKTVGSVGDGDNTDIPYAPFLFIQDKPPGMSGLHSPDIHVALTSMLGDMPFAGNLTLGNTYFIGARISNLGTAPVFNAIAAFWVAQEPVRVDLERTDLLRDRVFLLAYEIVDVPAGGEATVVCKNPWTPVILSGVPKEPGTRQPPGTGLVRWSVVVECFEPLTDPVVRVPPLSGTTSVPFNIGGDRHIAGHDFIVNILPSRPRLP